MNVAWTISFQHAFCWFLIPFWVCRKYFELWFQCVKGNWCKQKSLLGELSPYIESLAEYKVTVLFPYWTVRVNFQSHKFHNKLNSSVNKCSRQTLTGLHKSIDEKVIVFSFKKVNCIIESKWPLRNRIVIAPAPVTHKRKRQSNVCVPLFRIKCGAVRPAHGWCSGIRIWTLPELPIDAKVQHDKGEGCSGGVMLFLNGNLKLYEKISQTICIIHTENFIHT